MSDAAPLAEDEVKKFVEKWYLDLLDTHAPMDELLACLADEELEMVFPEQTARGHAGFRDWYDRIIHTFFDEAHAIKELSVSIDGEVANVNVLVNWQAHTWTPPEPRSKWLGFNAGQRWVVKRSPTTGQPMVVKYIVDTFDPMEGSTGL